MIGIDLIGLLVLGLFVVLLIVFIVFGDRWPVSFRKIQGYEALTKALERAVESGERVHLSLGTGSLIGADSAAAFAGLVVLTEIAKVTSLSDRPAVVTTGDGAMAIVAQDSLRSAYREVGALDRYEPISARMLGPTPFSYVASIPILLESEKISANALIGAFGAEGALAADFGERKRTFVLAGTEDIQSQALLYATAEYPLIGEEIFAGGAYLDVGPAHRASLRVQDTIRFIIVGGILVGLLLSLLGISL
ncbi:MAG: hypothetical protein PVF85_11395 [Anaerolineales bacterium]|jgi:hypothetical protein